MRHPCLTVLVAIAITGASVSAAWIEKEVDSFQKVDVTSCRRSLLSSFSGTVQTNEPFLDVRDASGIRKLKRKPSKVFEHQNTPASGPNLAVVLYERKTEDAFVAIILNSLENKEIIGNVEFKSKKELQEVVQESMESNQQLNAKQRKQWIWNDTPDTKQGIIDRVAAQLNIASDTINLVSYYEPSVNKTLPQAQPRGIIYSEIVPNCLFPPKLVGAILTSDFTPENITNDKLTIIESAELDVQNFMDFAARPYYSHMDKQSKTFDCSSHQLLPFNLENPGIRVIEQEKEGGPLVLVGAENGVSFASLGYDISPKYSNSPQGVLTSIITITKPTLDLVLDFNLSVLTFRDIPRWKLVTNNRTCIELAAAQTQDLRTTGDPALLKWINDAFFLQVDKTDLVIVDNWQMNPIYYFETLANGRNYLCILCSITANVNGQNVEWFGVLRKDQKGDGSNSSNPSLVGDNIVDIKLTFHSRSIKTVLGLRLTVLVHSDSLMTLPPGKYTPVLDHSKQIAAKIPDDYRKVLGYTVSSPRLIRCNDKGHTREYVFKAITTLKNIPVFVPVHYASDVFTIRALYATVEEAFDELKYPYGTLHSFMFEEALSTSSPLLTTATLRTWMLESTKSLDDLLQNETLKPLLREYLTKTFCEENLNFYEDCERLKAIDGKEARIAEIKRMYEHYFVNDKNAINVNDATKENVKLLINSSANTENHSSTGDVHIFDEPLNEVKKMMRDDPLFRFRFPETFESRPKSKAPASCLAPAGINLKS